jgi:hypothetical protein
METIDPNYLCNCPYHVDNYTLIDVDEIMKTTEKFVETGTGWGLTRWCLITKETMSQLYLRKLYINLKPI